MIAGQARNKILELAGVEDATVDLVWDPPWEPGMMSAEAKQKLGIG
jgi:metal-sulfur cluster biosynthetic enzyme